MDFLFYLLTCGRSSLVSGTQNEIVVGWITLWGMIKVFWLDFSLHFWLCCLLCVCRTFGPKLASHYKPVENESNCPHHVRQTKSSIKKQIIARQSVQSMFSEQTFAQLRTELRCCFCEQILPRKTALHFSKIINSAAKKTGVYGWYSQKKAVSKINPKDLPAQMTD